MARKGLSKEKVIEAATEFIEEKGYKDFSIRELATRLNIKAASLYNYITSMDELNREVALKAIEELKSLQEAALADKERDEALHALAVAYRDFAHRRPQLYKVIMQLPYMEAQKLLDNGADIIAPVMQALDMYQISAVEKMQYQRILRSVMHGFSDLETAGYFAHFPVDNDQSYHLAIDNIIRNLHALENKKE